MNEKKMRKAEETATRKIESQNYRKVTVGRGVTRMSSRKLQNVKRVPDFKNRGVLEILPSVISRAGSQKRLDRHEDKSFIPISQIFALYLHGYKNRSRKHLPKTTARRKRVRSCALPTVEEAIHYF